LIVHFSILEKISTKKLFLVKKSCFSVGRVPTDVLTNIRTETFTPKFHNFCLFFLCSFWVPEWQKLIFIQAILSNQKKQILHFWGGVFFLT
jgi:hypothetical protein